MIYFIRNLFGIYSPPRGKNNSFCKIVGGEANRVYYGGIEIREPPLIAYPRYQGSLVLVPVVGENPGNEVTLAAGSDEKLPVLTWTALFYPLIFTLASRRSTRYKGV